MGIISIGLSFLVVASIVLPLLACAIGMLIPESHIVSRSVKLNISSKRLWDILVDVSNYPEWQPRIEKVTIQEVKKVHDNNRTVFIEHSTRKRYTVIIHHERTPYKCLLRILEERPSIDGQRKMPTFSGSWTFEITQPRETENQVTLKITEQGIIKKPLIRVTHMLLFGFHRRIDIFINDLRALIVKQDHGYSSYNKEQEKTGTSNDIIHHSVAEELDNVSVCKKEFIEVPETYHSTMLLSSTDDEHDTIAEKPDHITTEEELPYSTCIKSTTDNVVDHLAETNDTLMTESKLVSGWDLVSEIYERPSKVPI